MKANNINISRFTNEEDKQQDIEDRQETDGKRIDTEAEVREELLVMNQNQNESKFLIFDLSILL